MSHFHSYIHKPSQSLLILSYATFSFWHHFDLFPSCYHLCHEFGKAQKLKRQYSVDFKASLHTDRTELVRIVHHCSEVFIAERLSVRLIIVQVQRALVGP